MKTLRPIVILVATCLLALALFYFLRSSSPTKKELSPSDVVIKQTNQITQQAVLPASNTSAILKIAKVEDAPRIKPEDDPVSRSNVEDGGSWSRAQYLLTLQNTMRRQAMGTNNVEGEFTVNIDPQSGRYATVSSNNVVTLKEKDGRVVWFSDITTFVRTNRIHSAYLSGKNIIITLDMKKVDIGVNKETGKVGISVY